VTELHVSCGVSWPHRFSTNSLQFAAIDVLISLSHIYTSWLYRFFSLASPLTMGSAVWFLKLWYMTCGYTWES
jgi:hypothetical protein